MAKLKELQAQAQAALEKYHTLNKRIEAIKKKRRERKQEICKHEKTYITSVPDYCEEGRIRQQTYYEICVSCKKRLRVRVNEPVWKDLETKSK